MLNSVTAFENKTEKKKLNIIYPVINIGFIQLFNRHLFFFFIHSNKKTSRSIPKKKLYHCNSISSFFSRPAIVDREKKREIKMNKQF